MKYDAIVVGSGPNGLAAAITLQRKGMSTLLIEGADAIGGGLRTKELTLPGYHHDVCSAIHPMAVASPFFQELQLEKHGVEFIHPDICAAHPLDNGETGVLLNSFEETATRLGVDEKNYRQLFGNVVRDWERIAPDALGPIGIPSHPLPFINFGLRAIRSAEAISRKFKTERAKALWSGMAAHSLLSFDKLSSAAVGMVLAAAAHLYGWPIPRGGSQSIANAMAEVFKSLGGTIQTSWYVKAFEELPAARIVIMDVTPGQLLEIAGHKLSAIYQWQLRRYRYGPGVFKVDFALDGPVPFISADCRRAGTVHIGNTFRDVARSEKSTASGKIPESPFVLLAQQSTFDDTRAPEGKHTAWAYCHVPNGSTVDMTSAIEKQIARYAPGFRDLIKARHTFNTEDLQLYNPNYIGGDINGGAIDITQLFTRPVLRSSPYRTSMKGLYICSASTPPGGGVHGMGGYHAASVALRDQFPNLKFT